MDSPISIILVLVLNDNITKMKDIVVPSIILQKKNMGLDTENELCSVHFEPSYSHKLHSKKKMTTFLLKSTEIHDAHIFLMGLCAYMRIVSPTHNLSDTKPTTY